jgi:uncharacterized protein (TIGR03118 family)
MRCSTVTTALVAVFISYLGTPAAVKAGGYLETDLVANRPGVAVVLDPDLVNPWGIAESATSPFWVSDNGTGVSTLYSSTTNNPIVKNSLVVSIPTCDDPLGRSGKPTGAVFNIDGGPTGGFRISGVDKNNNPTSASAVFLFATEDGTIIGWNPGVNPKNFDPNKAGTYGIIAFPDCPLAAKAAAYKALAIATDSNGTTRLYATNFRSGMVEVYNNTFHAVGTETTFVDPNLPASFSPFNVAVIDGKLFVTFAIRNPATGDNVPGKGSGIVDVFDLDGTNLQRFAQGGPLKAPWGMAHVPSGFGALGDTLWIGNFGDGQINAFNFDSGAFIDKVRDRNGKPLVIDGLWALHVGNGGNGGDPNKLYFTAGPNDEKDGLFGSLSPN